MKYRFLQHSYPISSYRLIMFLTLSACSGNQSNFRRPDIDEGTDPADVEVTTITLSLDENTSSALFVQDIEGITGTSSYELSARSEEEADQFLIDDAGVLRFRDIFDFDHETQSDYQVTIRITEEDESVQETIVTLSITDLNDVPPNFVGAPSAVTINEGTAFSQSFAAIPDIQGATVTYSLAGEDADKFTIDAAGLVAAPAFDADGDDAKDSYALTVIATTGSGDDSLSSRHDFTLNITDVNDEAPDFGDAPNEATIEEGEVFSQSFAATSDITGATVTYSLVGEDADKFTIDATGLVTAPAFDAEADDAKDSYHFTITATVTQDGRTTSETHHFTLNIENANDERPVITSSDQGATLFDGLVVSADPILYQATGTYDKTPISWSIKDEGDGGLFELNDTGGVSLKEGLVVNRTIKDSYHFTIIATSGDLPPVEKSVTLSVATLYETVHLDGVIAGQESLFYYQPFVPGLYDIEFELSDNPDLAGDDVGFFDFDDNTGILTFSETHKVDPSIKSHYSLMLNGSFTVYGQEHDFTQIIHMNAFAHPVEIHETIRGTADDDVLIATQGDDMLFGEGGNDVLISGVGENLLDGGEGFDAASYERSRFAVDVNLGQAREPDGTLLLGPDAGPDAQNDVLVSIENLRGSAYDDYLTGDWRANVIEGGDGADRLIGGGGGDTLSYANAQGAVVVDLSAQRGEDGFITLSDAQGADQVKGFLHIQGSAFADHLIGNHDGNHLWGGDGNDVLKGGAGADRLIGGDGTDRLIGGLGVDRLVGGVGADHFALEPSFENAPDIVNDFTIGSDKIEVIVSDKSADFASVTALLDDAGFAISYVTEADDSQTATITFDAGTDATADDVKVMTLIGLTSHLTLSDFALLEADDDAAQDHMNWHPLDHTTTTVTGTGRDDGVSFAAFQNAVTTSYDEATSIWTATSGDQSITLNSIEMLIGTSLADTLIGHQGRLVLAGGAGNDVIEAGGGDDRLLGGAGDDRLDGGAGVDTLDGGSGSDQLTGGAGEDLFLFWQSPDNGPDDDYDIITDFTLGDDKIRLFVTDAQTLDEDDNLSDILQSLNMGLSTYSDDDGTHAALYHLGADGVRDRAGGANNDDLLLVIQSVDADTLSLSDFDII